MDSMNESDRVALVTGASRRIGAEIVRGLHAAGYRVLLHYHRSEEAAQQLAGALNAERPDSVLALRADLDDTAALDELVRRAIDAWGHLDALVNNASAFYPTPLGTVTESQWDALLGSNLKAPFFLCQAAAPQLARRQGAIVNLVDVYAERPLKGYPVYSVAKAGLAALTRSLAVELAPDVRVNGVAPGAILWPEQTDGGQTQADILARIPLARSGSPADIAGAVRFLLADAPYVTGQIIAVDGGRSVFI
ncbi:MAG: pteridine reductase [Methylococcus sp.]|nr:MAG: pteridine reductase [Methylococcus sp.]